MMSRMEYITRYAHGAMAIEYTDLIFSLGEYGSRLPSYTDLLEKYSIFKQCICTEPAFTENLTVLAIYNYQYSAISNTSTYTIISTTTVLYVHVFLPYIKYITLSLIQYVLSTSTLDNMSIVIEFIAMARYIVGLKQIVKSQDDSRNDRSTPTYAERRWRTGRHFDLMMVPRVCRYKYIYTHIFTAIVTHHLQNMTFNCYRGYKPAQPLYINMICIEYPGHYRIATSEDGRSVAKNVKKSLYVSRTYLNIPAGIKLPVDWATSTEYD